MKRLIFTLFILPLLANFSIAQVQSPINLDLLFELQKLENTNQTDQVLHVLVKGNLDVIQEEVRLAGGTYKFGLKNIASVSVPASAIRTMTANPDIKRIEYYNHQPQLLGNFIRENNNLDSLHNGMGALPQGLDGEGVIVATIDSGMDWRHPDLQNENGTTRIKYIWDQTVIPNNTPYNYGYESDEDDINGNTPIHDPHVPGTNGHGNGTIGVAAGNGNAVEGEHIGAAPKSDLIHVNLDLGSGWFSHFVDGMDYIFSKADELGQACVINSSVGTYRGSHDTRGLATQMIENMLDEKPGRVLVQAAGNGASIRHHLGYEVTTDTVFSWFKVNVNTLGFVYFDLYADKADWDDVYFSLGLRRKSDLSLRSATNFFNIQEDFTDIPLMGIDSIARNLYDDETGELLGEIQIYAELNQGTYDMAFVVMNQANNLDYWELSTTGSGKFDVWSNGSLMGTSSIEPPHLFPQDFVDIDKHIFADTLKSIVSAWNCSPKVISVANYSNRTSWTGFDGMTYSQPTPHQEKIPVSSVGPTRTGLQKPDIAASGDFTFALQALERLEELTTLPNQADRLAPEGWHARWSGTSISAPVVTGTVACYLQQFPNATYAEVKAGIENSAKVDEHVLHQYGTPPNDAWGYGKLDGFNFVNNAVLAVDVQAPELAEVTLQNSPNPFRDETRITYNLNEFAGQNIQIRITDMMGRTLYTHFSNKKTDSFVLELKKMSAGTYFYTLIVDGNSVKTQKMIKT